MVNTGSKHFGTPTPRSHRKFSWVPGGHVPINILKPVNPSFGHSRTIAWSCWSWYLFCMFPSSQWTIHRNGELIKVIFCILLCVPSLRLQDHAVRSGRPAPTALPRSYRCCGCAGCSTWRGKQGAPSWGVCNRGQLKVSYKQICNIT